MSKEFKNYVTELEKKIGQSSLVSFHSFCNLCQKFFLKCGYDQIGGICRATFAAQQSYSVLHSAAQLSVDAPLGLCKLGRSDLIEHYIKLVPAVGCLFESMPFVSEQTVQ